MIFNINLIEIPTISFLFHHLRNKVFFLIYLLQELKDKENADVHIHYLAVMRALVWRYVSAMHRRIDDEPVTEDDINELKGDVSSLRYELLEVFEKNGMDVSFTDRKEKGKVK